VYDRAEIIVETPLPDETPISQAQTWIIKDPTDFSNPSLPLIFVPRGRLQQNGYANYNIYNETQKESSKITKYDATTHILFCEPVNKSWTAQDNFSIRKKNPIVKGNTTIIPFVPPVTTTTSIVITDQTNPADLSNISNYYKNMFLRILPTPYPYIFINVPNPSQKSYSVNNKSINNTSRHITFYSGKNDPWSSSVIYSEGIVVLYLNNYYISIFNTSVNLNQEPNNSPTFWNDYTIMVPYEFVVYPPFTDEPTSLYSIEVLDFSYDNFNPFVYTGSTESQQQMVCYKVELISLILPNSTLIVGEGSRIAFYPYVYVTLSNVSASSAGSSNMIYSNNPSSTKVVFRVPIDDLTNPTISTFIHVDGDGMTQTMKFKPNDNLFFSVTMSNGELYKTSLEEYYSPMAPNLSAQISACFSIERL
jgi:hypothetical protein